MTTKHDRKVKRVAAGYKSQGYKVRADVPGYERPLNVGGRRADVVAIKGRKKVLVEVETPKSFKSHSEQIKDLRKIAKKRKYKFRAVKTK